MRVLSVWMYRFRISKAATVFFRFITVSVYTIKRVRFRNRNLSNLNVTVCVFL